VYVLFYVGLSKITLNYSFCIQYIFLCSVSWWGIYFVWVHNCFWIGML